MKTIKQIREEYDSVILDQVEVMPEQIMLEGTTSRISPIPSSKEMPNMLVFRRIQYRIFPNKQVVALYYSKMINKYLSIPFGPDGNVNLSEAIIVEDETLLEDWQSVNRKDKTDGLSQAAVNAYRRENPGSKLKTAVTERNPKGKRAARRKSFCSRMGGMKKRLTSAKTARDPDSRINKALRRWNCEESFYNKLHEKRMQQNEDALDVATFIPGTAGNIASGASAIRNLKRGNYVDAAIDAVGAIDPTKAIGGPISVSGGIKALRGASKIGSGIAKSAGKELTKASIRTIGKTGTRVARGAGKLAGGAAKVGGKLALKGAAAALGALAGSGGDDNSVGKPLGQSKAPEAHIKTGTVSSKASQYTPTASSKIKQAELARTKVQENKISDIRSMIDSGESLHEMFINGRTITLNTNMAKRIVEVYDSVNTKNKKVVESMLNEDLESFKKLLNFSIKV